MTLQEMYDKDIHEARAASFEEGRRHAADAITNWQGTLKSDSERKIQNLFASIAGGTRNPYRICALAE